MIIFLVQTFSRTAQQPTSNPSVATVDSTATTTVTTGAFMYLGYAANGAVAQYPYFTFDFKVRWPSPRLS